MKVGALLTGVEDVGLVLSADGSRVGYVYRKAGNEFVVIDGKTEGPFDDAWGPKFAADGKTAIIVYRQGREIFKKTIPLE